MTTICFNYIHVLNKKAAFIPDASIGVLRRNSITSASRSLPDFERGFRPACEVKTGTFDPRTTFCRPVIPRSSLITNSACSALSVSAFSTTAFPS